MACVAKDLRPFRFVVGDGLLAFAQALINIGAHGKFCTSFAFGDKPGDSVVPMVGYI